MSRWREKRLYSLTLQSHFVYYAAGAISTTFTLVSFKHTKRIARQV